MSDGGGVEETADQKQEQRNNLKLWQYYQTAYKPFIDKHITRENAEVSNNIDERKTAGQVNAEVMKSVSAASAAPASGNPVALTRTMDNAAEVGSDAKVTAASKVRQRELGNLQDLVDIGRGQQTTVQQNQEALADQSVQKAIADKKADVQTSATIQNSIGSAAGVGAAAYSRMMNDPGELYKSTKGDINKVDFDKGGWGNWSDGSAAG